jgi:hypothetical protein
MLLSNDLMPTAAAGALFACDETIKSPQAITARFNFHTKRALFSLSLSHTIYVLRGRLRR